MTRTKLFQSNRSQAVRLPKEVAFPESVRSVTVLLDTSLCIRVLRDRPQGARDRFNLAADELCISTIVLAELLHGAAKSARPDHDRQEVDRFAARLDVLPFDASAADQRPISVRSWSGPDGELAPMTCSSPGMPVRVV